jgi:preprotein translocase subunit YajC
MSLLQNSLLFLALHYFYYYYYFYRFQRKRKSYLITKLNQLNSGNKINCFVDLKDIFKIL